MKLLKFREFLYLQNIITFLWEVDSCASTDVSLVKLFDFVDVIYGRKKLQKMVHLLKSSGAELPFKYEYHYYVPYSAQLQSTINQMVEQNFIEEKLESGAYTYRMTVEGQKFKEMLETKGNFSFAFNEQVVYTLSEQTS